MSIPPRNLIDGARAEDLAVRFLIGKGLKIVARNVKNRAGEIDVIAQEGKTLVFVEVRLRRAISADAARDSINPAKQRRWRNAADLYLSGLNRIPMCRFDAILLSALDERSIVWERDVLQGRFE